MEIFLWILCGIGGLVVLYVLYFMLALAFALGKPGERNSKFYRFFLGYHITWILFFLRVKVKVSGEEKLQGLGRFLLVSNHRSNYDPMVTMKGLKKYQLGFLSKPENFKVFALGRVIKQCCFLPIDRENPRNAIMTLRKASDLIKADQVSIGVYPEGTRSKDCNLLPFHDGVFKIAQMANVPIVVMTTTGTEKIKKNTPFRKSIVNLDIVKVIDTEQVNALTTHQIGDIVREDFIKNIQKIEAKN